MWAPADFSISFFLPTVSKATSVRASPPMGRTESTMPFPKAVCSTMSPCCNCSRGAAGAAFFRAEDACRTEARGRWGAWAGAR